jgi:hypothetical protein
MADNDRIIDRDADFYAGEVEECTRRLCRCRPEHEDYWKRRRDLAQSVHDRLVMLRTLIDEGEPK